MISQTTGQLGDFLAERHRDRDLIADLRTIGDPPDFLHQIWSRDVGDVRALADPTNELVLGYRPVDSLGRVL